ncbi:unnamed protein product [Darwinula stevensoni]|uniref:C2 domain-containing protein n=1 Tax=Darwinula stevensoni TaxID=69355 RepID=A0A7R8X3J0_9CRUS|nr:unnamed protein product [Darwinula stevensoni]CAG0884579.1 unnamed protein product [Darwinula stevensoni]
MLSKGQEGTFHDQGERGGEIRLKVVSGSQTVPEERRRTPDTLAVGFSFQKEAKIESKLRLPSSPPRQSVDLQSFSRFGVLVSGEMEPYRPDVAKERTRIGSEPCSRDHSSRKFSRILSALTAASAHELAGSENRNAVSQIDLLTFQATEFNGIPVRYSFPHPNALLADRNLNICRTLQKDRWKSVTDVGATVRAEEAKSESGRKEKDETRQETRERKSSEVQSGSKCIIETPCFGIVKCKAFSFDAVNPDRKTLLVSVFEAGIEGKHDAIGSGHHTFGQGIWPDDGQHLSLPILPYRMTMTEGRGVILLSLSYQPSRNRLSVVVVRARELRLPPTRLSKSHDIYTKVELYCKGERVEKKKSRPVRGEPDWNESFQFYIPLGLIDHSRIVACVKVHAVLKRDPLLGCAAVGPLHFDMNGSLTHWGKAMASPAIVTRWHHLYL